MAWKIRRKVKREVFRSVVSSDEDWSRCPFCGREMPLTTDEFGSSYECVECGFAASAGIGRIGS